MADTFVQSTDDVVRFLTDQHNLIKDMFEDVFAASSDDARDKAFTELRQLLAVHETAEEMVVHPRVRNEVEGGDVIVDARLTEEREAKKHLSALEGMDIGSKKFLDELAVFRTEVLDHAEREELEEFNRLQREIDAEDLAKMAKAVQAAQAIAPTRPHAGVESAKLNFAVGPFASMLDRARDAITAALK
ncbi:hemerythrin domain-containing protein [Mycolicibacterium sp. 120270]|uniref:hemerythrin domain-containing protein n=1 Tax=Mycolicibacterium sp. 120270 TaxID=3090600 RepID=UPI00299D96CB|nr:hemerythrin domain-containing protein [Mycolicibacterium sp. 120270]MDX1884952.1 hemerythrin domain-containing protein [Mycolicibacterium sp. 120270]